jgi:hypothetical protein
LSDAQPPCLVCSSPLSLGLPAGLVASYGTACLLFACLLLLSTHSLASTTKAMHRAQNIQAEAAWVGGWLVGRPYLGHRQPYAWLLGRQSEGERGILSLITGLEQARCVHAADQHAHQPASQAQPPRRVIGCSLSASRCARFTWSGGASAHERASTLARTLL